MVNHDCGDEDGKRAGRGAVQLPDTGCSLTRLLRPVGMPNVNVTMVSVWLYWLDCFYMLGMGILQQSKFFKYQLHPAFVLIVLLFADHHGKYLKARDNA